MNNTLNVFSCLTQQGHHPKTDEVDKTCKPSCRNHLLIYHLSNSSGYNNFFKKFRNLENLTLLHKSKMSVNQAETQLSAIVES